MSETNAKPKNPSERRDKFVGRVVLPVLAVAMLGTGWAAVEHDKNQGLLRDRVAALKNLDRLSPLTIVLNDKTDLYFTPKEKHGSYGSSDVDSLTAGTIPEGKIWVVKGLTSTVNPGWVAVTMPGSEKDIRSFEDRAGETVWAQYDEGDARGNALIELKLNQDGSVYENGKPTPGLGAPIETDESNYAAALALFNKG